MRVVQTEPMGFTLIEVLMATLLIGIAITALLAASRAFTMINATGTDMSTAEFLIEEIRELTMTVAVVDPEGGTGLFGPEEPNLVNYDDIDDFDGVTLSPPIGATGNALNEFANFSQQIVVENVSATNFDQVVGDHTSNFYRIRVTVSKNGGMVNENSWIRTRY